MNDWYEINIEEEVRDIVKYLRNNGINTECSCGHEMYVQCQVTLDGSLKDIYDLVYCYYHEVLQKEPNFQIDVLLKIDNGHLYSTLDIKLK